MKPAADVAERLKDLEEAGGFTHAELGRLAGRLVGAISEWTLGKRVPPESALERLAANLNLPISVFEDGGPMPSTLLRAAQAGSSGGLGPSRVREAQAGSPGGAYRGEVDSEEPAEGPGWQFGSQLSDDELIERMVFDRPGFTRFLQAEFRDPRIPIVAKLKRLDFLERLARQQGKPFDPGG